MALLSWWLGELFESFLASLMPFGILYAFFVDRFLVSLICRVIFWL